MLFLLMTLMLILALTYGGRAEWGGWINTKESLTEKEEKLLLILLVKCVVFSSMTEDVVNLDNESSTDSESLAEPKSDSEANNLLDCWDN